MTHSEAKELAAYAGKLFPKSAPEQLELVARHLLRFDAGDGRRAVDLHAGRFWGFVVIPELIDELEAAEQRRLGVEALAAADLAAHGRAFAERRARERASGEAGESAMAQAIALAASLDEPTAQRLAGKVAAVHPFYARQAAGPRPWKSRALCWAVAMAWREEQASPNQPAGAGACNGTCDGGGQQLSHARSREEAP